MSPDRGRSRSGGTRRGARSAATRPPSPPARGEEDASAPWTVRPASQQARREWDAAAAAEPDLLQAERDRLTLRPLDRGTNPRRTARLHGPLASRRIAGVPLPQWQHELTGGGRIWYCPDKDTRTVWVTKVALRHPRETE